MNETLGHFPKIIHQTWKTRNLPDNFRQWSNSWKYYNPDFDYRFYTDEDCHNFIKKHYSEYLNMYEDFTNVQKADLFRYLVLHKYGGVYADIDTSCFRSLIPLLKDVKETLITGIEYENYQLEQWFIISVPNNQLLLDLVNEIQSRWWSRWFYSFIKNENDITYWMTGPEVFTSIMSKSDKVLVKPKGILGSFDTRCLSKESFLQHHFAGSWKKNWTRMVL